MSRMGSDKFLEELKKKQSDLKKKQEAADASAPSLPKTKLSKVKPAVPTTKPALSKKKSPGSKKKPPVPTSKPRDVGRVAPSKKNLNTLVRTGTLGLLHANFNRAEAGKGTHPKTHVDHKGEDKDRPQREARIVRPGAIILPNLDIDDDDKADRKRYSFSDTDAHDNYVNDADDDRDITYFSVAKPGVVNGNATRVLLRVHKKDMNRIRIWRVRNSAAGDVRAKPPHVTEVIGPTSKKSEYEIYKARSAVQAPKEWVARFIVEACTMLGDPKFKPATEPAPLPPGTLSKPAPKAAGGSEQKPKANTSKENAPIYANAPLAGDTSTTPRRDPGDVWVEIIHETDAGKKGMKKLSRLHDVGLFTIAPWIMTWNTLTCQRVYVAYIRIRDKAPAKQVVPTFANALAYENHSMVWELQHGCYRAGLGARPDEKDTGKEIARDYYSDIKKPDQVPFFVIGEYLDTATNKGKYYGFDRWVQDEFEIGYCYAPDRWLHVALHTPRGRGLDSFVEREMAHPGLGVFNAVHDRIAHSACVDYGGNLEVSPPVAKATGKQKRDAAGPGIKKHRAAPFGKIILGDCGPQKTKKKSKKRFPGLVHHEFREFLFAQRVQPVLPLDTSWLYVGHVDEFMSFVRADKEPNFRLLIASVKAMKYLLEETLKMDPGATLHAGKYRGNKYDETFVEDWIGRRKKEGKGGKRERLIFSEQVERQKVSKILNRMKKGLAIDDKDILLIPTFWEVKKGKDDKRRIGYQGPPTIADNVGMVNMLVVNEHLMIPRPHGPRLPLKDAEKVVESTLKRLFRKKGLFGGARSEMPELKLLSSYAQSLKRQYFWARPGEPICAVPAYFARPPAKLTSAKQRRAWRRSVIHLIKNNAFKGGAGDWSAIWTDPDYKDAYLKLWYVVEAQLSAKAKNDEEFSDWQRVRFGDDTVDVIELYMTAILKGVGNKLHFVENFESYHAQAGEVHCGTNAKREPPEASADFKDRWWDKGVYDPDYDTRYDPNS